ncbi:hypothetical protein [Burkholderia ubonensis]|uniref:hypothetical protein n=1 Tax=Burkholderia ubonensis TaxID=101571 RepID=UPI000A891477|nr:hypothetical protein [Burkholderia ubonensis]
MFFGSRRKRHGVASMSTRNCEENAKKYRESPDETGFRQRGRMRAPEKNISVNWKKIEPIGLRIASHVRIGSVARK